MITRLLREPLLRFLALGAILFGLYNLVRERSIGKPEEIVVSATRLANLADGFSRTWQRPPSQDELQRLIDDYIREEIFYREGRAAGLDQDDVVIRRRVRQKMEFLAQEVSGTEPSNEQLAAFLASHMERFRSEDRLTFRQIFLSPSRHAGTMDREIKHAATALSAGSADAKIDVAGVGDPFVLGDEFRAASPRDTASAFGDSFAKKVFALDQGRWQGPITSTYGQHFVFIEERLNGSVPPLETIKPQVTREWSEVRQAEAEQDLYRSLRDRYQIIVETGPPGRTMGTAPR